MKVTRRSGAAPKHVQGTSTSPKTQGGKLKEISGAMGLCSKYAAKAKKVKGALN